MSNERDLHKRIEALNRKRLEKQPESESAKDRLRRSLRQKRRKRELRRMETAEPAEPASESSETAHPDAIVYRRNLPRSQKEPRGQRAGATPGIPLEDILPGREVTTRSGGKVYVIEEKLECPRRGRPELCTSLPGAIGCEGGPLPRILADICDNPPSACEDLLFLDLETAGLSSAPLFLIGMLLWTEDGPLVRQCLARDYSEERAALELYMQEARGRQVIVSFNGKSFDVPFVRVRAITHAVDYCEPAWHLDMLHVSRRAWKGRFRNYKLQTLETRVCGRRRSGDIPGAEIPAAYHAFVRSGNAAEMSLIVKHNRLDLLTLAELLTKLPD